MLATLLLLYSKPTELKVLSWEPYHAAMVNGRCAFRTGPRNFSRWACESLFSIDKNECAVIIFAYHNPFGGEQPPLVAQMESEPVHYLFALILLCM